MTNQRHPTRAYNARTDATTETLVHDVTLAAREAANHARWPFRTTRSEAMQMVHALAADVKYKEDPADQVIQMPHVLLSSRVGDCKSTAVLCASLLAAAGCRVELKFLQYEAARPWWEHVYCLADGVPVDPLLPLGREYPYLRAITTRIR